jgi:hypothetical protein
MSQLVDELKNEHQWLVGRVTEIRQNPGAPDVLKQLVQVKKGLLAHLRKEDDRLYPMLMKAGASDPKAREVYEMFANEMKKIGAAAIAFFEKYSPERSGPLGGEFIKDLDGLIKVLGDRIASEEMTLYPTYDRVAANVPAGALPHAAPDDMPAHIADGGMSGAKAAAYFAGALAVLGAMSVALYRALL